MGNRGQVMIEIDSEGAKAPILESLLPQLGVTPVQKVQPAKENLHNTIPI
jgi:hypothetical protein